MTAAIVIAIGVFLIIAGFTGRWRAVLSALVPQFTHSAKAGTAT